MTLTLNWVDIIGGVLVLLPYILLLAVIFDGRKVHKGNPKEFRSELKALLGMLLVCLLGQAGMYLWLM